MKTVLSPALLIRFLKVYDCKLVLLLLCFTSVWSCGLLYPKRANIEIGPPVYAFASCAGGRKPRAASFSEQYQAALKFAGDQRQNDLDYLHNGGPHALFRSQTKYEAYDHAQAELACVMNGAKPYQYLVDHPDFIDIAAAQQLLELTSSIRQQSSYVLFKCSQPSANLKEALSEARGEATQGLAVADLVARLLITYQSTPMHIVSEVCRIENEAIAFSIGRPNPPALASQQSTQSPRPSTVTLHGPPISSSVATEKLPAAPPSFANGGKSGNSRPAESGSECQAAITELVARTNELLKEIDHVELELSAIDWGPSVLADCSKPELAAPRLMQFTVDPSMLRGLSVDETSEISLAGGISPYFSYPIDPGLNVASAVGGPSPPVRLRLTVTDYLPLHRLLLTDYIGNQASVTVSH